VSSKRKVTSLFDTTLDLLTEYVDCIESLDGMPDTLKVVIAPARPAHGHHAETANTQYSSYGTHALIEMQKHYRLSRKTSSEMLCCGWPQVKLAQSAAAHRKMSAEVAHIFVAGAPSEVQSSVCFCSHGSIFILYFLFQRSTEV
jgi:predicted glycosyltransferase